MLILHLISFAWLCHNICISIRCHTLFSAFSPILDFCDSAQKTFLLTYFPVHQFSFWLYQAYSLLYSLSKNFTFFNSATSIHLFLLFLVQWNSLSYFIFLNIYTKVILEFQSVLSNRWAYLCLVSIDWMVTLCMENWTGSRKCWFLTERCQSDYFLNLKTGMA